MAVDDLAVILMTKFPEPGRVKTRLAPELGPERAAAVHRAFLVHLARRLDRFAPAELVICYDPPERRSPMRELLSPHCSATFLAQEEGNLGERLAAAARRVGGHYRRLLFLGVDSPDVPDEHLRRAAALTGEASVTLGPAADGGFWCLGLWNEVDAGALLDGVAWSSGREFRQVLDHAAALSYAVALADGWEDVDEPDDLRRLLDRLGRSDRDEDRRLLSELSRIAAP